MLLHFNMPQLFDNQEVFNEWFSKVRVQRGGLEQDGGTGGLCGGTGGGGGWEGGHKGGHGGEENIGHR